MKLPPLPTCNYGRDTFPMPGIMNKPFLLTSATAVWASESNRLFATFLEISQLSASVWMICVCVIVILPFGVRRLVDATSKQDHFKQTSDLH
jgi:hypothetical protein